MKQQANARGLMVRIPPITDEVLDRYMEIAETCEPQARDYMLQMIKAVERFQETPDTDLPACRDSRGFPCYPLRQEEIARIWDDVPWETDLEAMTPVIRALPKEAKEAAIHLRAYVKKLSRDQQPLTLDRPLPTV